MNVMYGRNVHEIFPGALHILLHEGHRRNSRNGEVLQAKTPVTTMYARPQERVLFYKNRDANPFFHLYESIWMLCGKNDVKSVAKYAANMANYSDYGDVFHGAYGFRWRNMFWADHDPNKKDQLEIIAERLSSDKDDRRCVLQMWNTEDDLGKEGKDFPCNTMATLQINTDGALDLVVFCRSNDIVWGAYGANAVHFSFLLEYMAHWINVPIGRMYQVSVNWHGYLNVLEKVKGVVNEEYPCPYTSGEVQHFPMGDLLSHDEVDLRLEWLLFHDRHNFPPTYEVEFNDDHPFWSSAYYMLRAHCLYRTSTVRERGVDLALECLSMADPKSDWIKAGKEWMMRRRPA